MPRAPKSKQKPPYPFVLEALAPLNPGVRRMFSGFAVYVGDRLHLMLWDHAKKREGNGIWLVVAKGIDPADASLHREFPSLRPLQTLHVKISHWLLLSSNSEDFESEALHACDLILRRDPRLGRVPQSRW